MTESDIELTQTLEQAVHDLANNTNIGEIVGVVSRAYHLANWSNSINKDTTTNLYLLTYIDQHIEAIGNDRYIIPAGARMLSLYTNSTKEGQRRIGYLIENSLHAILHLDNGKQDTLYGHLKVSLGFSD